MKPRKHLRNGRPKVQIRPSVTLDTDRILKVEQQSSRNQYTKGDLIDRAVQSYFDNNRDDLEALLLRRLDKLKLNLDATRQDVLILTEAFHLFLRVFLTNTAEVAAENRTAAERRGGERLEVFIATLADRVSQGGLAEQIKGAVMPSQGGPAED